MTVPEKLQEVLDWSGIKQQKLSQLSGISKSTISGYICGKRKLTVDALERIASALDMSTWVFLNGEPLPVTEMDLTEEERQHVREYRRLTYSERQAINYTMQVFNEKKRRKEG